YVVDLDAERRAAVLDRFPEVQTGAEIDPILEDDALDGVVISTPTQTHYDLARRALRAGKHVLVEKPLTSSVETSVELCSLAESMARVLMVGHVVVYNEAARVVKECIERDELGRLYYLSMVRTNLGPIRVDVDAAWDLAAHDVSLANFWLDAVPLSAAASGGEFINAGIADVVFATLRYPDDVLVNLHASWLNPRKARDITVVGDRKMLTFDDTALETPIRIYDKQVLDDRSHPGFVDSISSFRMSVKEGEVSEPAVRPNEPLRNECEHFLDTIEGGGRPLSGGPEGLAVVRVLEAMSKSLNLRGQEVAVETA
ncbi:MAG: Gfo/Idh/MocA family oxidoreductase, partial [Myxococcota bacterium]|nr:Gfo/Idh/MocA family oxidoreductase [Myxococcota bacterium]